MNYELCVYYYFSFLIPDSCFLIHLSYTYNSKHAKWFGTGTNRKKRSQSILSQMQHTGKYYVLAANQMSAKSACFVWQALAENFLDPPQIKDEFVACARIPAVIANVVSLIHQ